MTTPTDDQRIAELRRERADLERRLTDGWRAIDERIAEGKDARTWEERWIALLMRYEKVCDELSIGPVLTAPRHADASSVS